MTALSRYLQEQPDFKDPSSSSSPLPALYADLAAHKSSNRSSYDASVDWWARLLFNACLVGAQSITAASSSKGKQAEARTADRLVLHLDQLLIEECTIDEVGRPLGLGTVAVCVMLVPCNGALIADSFLCIRPNCNLQSVCIH